MLGERRHGAGTCRRSGAYKVIDRSGGRRRARRARRRRRHPSLLQHLSSTAAPPSSGTRAAGPPSCAAKFHSSTYAARRVTGQRARPARLPDGFSFADNGLRPVRLRGVARVRVRQPRCRRSRPGRLAGTARRRRHLAGRAADGRHQHHGAGLQLEDRHRVEHRGVPHHHRPPDDGCALAWTTAGRRTSCTPTATAEWWCPTCTTTRRPHGRTPLHDAEPHPGR